MCHKPTLWAGALLTYDLPSDSLSDSESHSDSDVLATAVRLFTSTAGVSLVAVSHKTMGQEARAGAVLVA